MTFVNTPDQIHERWVLEVYQMGCLTCPPRHLPPCLPHLPASLPSLTSPAFLLSLSSSLHSPACLLSPPPLPLLIYLRLSLHSSACSAFLLSSARLSPSSASFLHLPSLSPYLLCFPSFLPQSISSLPLHRSLPCFPSLLPPLPASLSCPP